jgi:tRNA isopentenyl-2-thiomethyl-A-37 hydroxylase MiaE
MYVIQHKNNKIFYKSRINNDLKHFVVDLQLAKKIDSKKKANEILKTFNKQENYIILKLNKKGEIIC